MPHVVPPIGRTVKLFLAGSAGEVEAEVIRRKATGMGNVVFLGALPQEALARLLTTADVFVLPSFFEGLPLVVIEALACGCRVVVTGLPGMDTWMPDGLCDDGLVERIPLPRLNGPDIPVPEDLPAFVQNLAQALMRQLSRSLDCERPSETDCRLAPFSWRSVFEKMQREYQAFSRMTE